MSGIGSSYDAMMEAQKEAQREKIRVQIEDLNIKITEAAELMTQFRGYNSKIAADKDSWSSEYNRYQGNEIVSVIFLTDRFEGNTAETLAGEIPEAVLQMNKVSGQMEELSGHTGNQITKLSNYIETLQEKVRMLYANMAAI